MKSMTGFGQSKRQTPNLSISMQGRSVNHRNLDVRLFVPPSLQSHELELSKLVKGFFSRGRVEFRIDFKTTDTLTSEAEFSKVHGVLLNLSEKFQTAPPTLSDVFSMQHSMTPKTKLEFDLSDIKADIKTCCENLVHSRLEEGKRLEPIIRSYIETIGQCLKNINNHLDENPERVYQKLSTRLRQQAQQFGLDAISEERLAQELILYLDKSDISEEIQRIESHIEGVRSLIEAGLPEIGKKLDFYMQEFFREANTIGSKTDFTEIIDEVVTMKVTIEKIREQAANIE